MGRGGLADALRSSTHQPISRASWEERRTAVADDRAERITDFIRPLRAEPGTTVCPPEDFDPGRKAGVFRKGDGIEPLRSGTGLLADRQRRPTAQVKRRQAVTDLVNDYRRERLSSRRLTTGETGAWGDGLQLGPGGRFACSGRRAAPAGCRGDRDAVLLLALGRNPDRRARSERAGALRVRGEVAGQGGRRPVGLRVGGKRPVVRTPAACPPACRRGRCRPGPRGRPPSPPATRPTTGCGRGCGAGWRLRSLRSLWRAGCVPPAERGAGRGPCGSCRTGSAYTRITGADCTAPTSTARASSWTWRPAGHRPRPAAVARPRPPGRGPRTQSRSRRSRRPTW